MIIFSVSCLNGEDGHGGGVVIVLNGVVSLSFYLTWIDFYPRHMESPKYEIHDNIVLHDLIVILILFLIIFYIMLLRT
jgi:hypothetical protein